jgi:hypothetical protein
MKIPRRGLLKQGALFAAAMMLPQTVANRVAAQQGASTADVGRIEASIVTHFSNKGFRQVGPAPLVTENFGFNGGLRYDDTGVLEAPASFVVQPCARTADIAERQRGDVLPFFHIFRFDGKPGEDRTDAFAHVFGYLTGPLKLDPASLAFVSIPSFEGLRPHATRAGVDWDRQVVLRDPDAALKAGDGSGIFRHPGDRTLPAIPTAGIYYWVGQGAAAPADTHPLPGAWTEIGELFIAENGGAAFGFGLERLLFAATGEMPTWDEQLPRLLAQIDRDSPRGSPPPGEAMFTKG